MGDRSKKLITGVVATVALILPVVAMASPADAAARKGGPQPTDTGWDRR